MGRGFQVWKFHLKISPWEEKPCLPRTVPNMTLQVTSKFIGFSVKIANFPKKFHQRFDEFFDARTAVFIIKHE